MPTNDPGILVTASTASIKLTVPQVGLSALLKGMNVYQKDIATAASVHQTTVSNTCLGKNWPNHNVMQAITVKVTDLLEEGLKEKTRYPNNTNAPWAWRTMAGSVVRAMLEGHSKCCCTPAYARGGSRTLWDKLLVDSGGRSLYLDYDELDAALVAGTPEWPSYQIRKYLTDTITDMIEAGLTVTVASADSEEDEDEMEVIEEIVPDPTPVITPVEQHKIDSTFPLPFAYKVASSIRKMQKERLSVTFSLRKLILWGQTYELLKDRLGYEHDQALGAGYFMAVVGKTAGEERRAVVEAFNSIFGFDPGIPDPPDDGTCTHPMDYVVRPLVEVGLPVWLAGPTGCGKTWSAVDIAKRLGRKAYRIQGTGDMTVDDLLGGWSAKDGSTYKEMGPLPLAMGFDGEPGLLIVDEGSAIPSEVLFELHAVLEGAPLVIKKFRGMTVEPKPGFGVMINDNTIGQAEANEYVGTNMMNEAFRDRFLFLDYDYMPKNRELKAVTMGIDRFTSEWVKEATPEQVKAVVTEDSNEFKLSPDALAKIRKAMGIKED